MFSLMRLNVDVVCMEWKLFDAKQTLNRIKQNGIENRLCIHSITKNKHERAHGLKALFIVYAIEKRTMCELFDAINKKWKHIWAANVAKIEKKKKKNKRMFEAEMKWDW